MINVPLLRKTMEHIESLPAVIEGGKPTETVVNPWVFKTGKGYNGEHTEFWNQKRWIQEGACGTAACLAGHAVLIDGCEPIPMERFDGMITHVKALPNDPNMTMMRGVCAVSIRDRAKDILGLDWNQAYELFDEDNTIEDLRRMVDDLIEQADGRNEN